MGARLVPIWPGEPPESDGRPSIASRFGRRVETNLARLRKRSLGKKRSLALREFALGIESLERFVAGAPLYQVHQAAFAVLALESEPVDPRL